MRKILLFTFLLGLSSQAQAQGPAVPATAPHEVNDVESVKIEPAKPDTAAPAVPDSEVKIQNETPEPGAAPTAEPKPEYKPADQTKQNTHAEETVRIQESSPADQRPSADQGEKIFDWSQHEGETQVHHPFAEKGLIRISKDDTYYYKVDESETNRAVSVQAGILNPTQLSNPAGGRGSTFAENYTGASTTPAILITKEYLWFNTLLGKVDLRVGSGVMIAQGHGHFVSTVNAQKQPLESLTFAALPNSGGVVYRMQFWHRQLFIPYGEGGGIAWTFTEIRDDNKGPKFGASLGAYAAAGVEFNMTYFDYLSRIQLDREYGVTGVFLTLEYRKILHVAGHYDFESDYINGGFLMTY